MYHTRQENFEMILVLYNEGFWRHKRRQKIWLTHLTLCQTLKILCIGATAFMLFLWIKLFMNEKDENEHWNFYKSTTCLSNTGYLQTFFWITFFENFMKRFSFFVVLKQGLKNVRKIDTAISTYHICLFILIPIILLMLLLMVCSLHTSTRSDLPWWRWTRKITGRWSVGTTLIPRVWAIWMSWRWHLWIVGIGEA